MNMEALKLSFILMGTGMIVLFLFMILLIAVVHFGVKFFRRFEKDKT